MNKKLILSLALSGLVLTATAQTTVAPAIPRDEKIEQQIETLLKKMTLDEKVGQMCELTIDLLQKRANPFAGLDPKNITVKDLQKIIKRYKLEKEFKLGKEMPSQDVMMKLYMRIQGIENAKGFQLDEAMLDSVIGKYKVGSILNVPNGVAQSVEKWQEIIKRIQEPLSPRATEFSVPPPDAPPEFWLPPAPYKNPLDKLVPLTPEAPPPAPPLPV